MPREEWEKVSAVRLCLRMARAHHDAGHVDQMRDGMDCCLWMLDELVELHGVGEGEVLTIPLAHVTTRVRYGNGTEVITVKPPKEGQP